MIVNAYKVNNNSIYVKIRGASAAVPHVPIHFIAVIDVSGSMDSDNRLKNVKLSLQHIIPLMTAEDKFSLVTFSDISRIICHNVTLDEVGKRQIEAHLERLRADGPTNIGSALTSVRDIIAHTPATHTVCTLLLTDGEANCGVTDTTDLVNLARNDRANTNIYSVGYGSLHNFELMRSFAENGNGSYAVVENLEHVATVFGDVLGGIMSIVAQNCEILLPSGASATTRLKTTEGFGGGTNVQVGNLYQGSEQALIVNNLPFDSSGARTLTYRYFNCATRSLATGTMAVQLESDASIQSEAEAYLLRLDAASVMNKVSLGTVTLDELDNMIRRLNEHQHVAWVPIIKAELQRVAHMIRDNASVPIAHVCRGVSGYAATNYAALSMGRGITLSSQPVEMSQEEANPFSTPTQRHVAGQTTRSVTGAMPPPIIRNVGGRGHLSPIPSLDYDGSVPRDLHAHFAAAAAVPLPVIIPPAPATFEEMGDDDRPVTPTAQIRRGPPAAPPALRRAHAVLSAPEPTQLPQEDDDIMN